VGHDFNRAILDEVGHRPWPMPGSPWIMTQTWNDLLFAHWPVDKRTLAEKIPPGIELDLHDGQAWLGIVPFHMTNVAPRGVPALPWVSEFPELNVRTYVRVGDKAGVFFFSLDASSALAVGAARTLFHLPYFTASMKVEVHGAEIRYRSRRTSSGASAAELLMSYKPAGPVFNAREGSLEFFLTERYCLFTTNGDGDVLTVDIHHPRWPLQPAEAAIEVNTMADAAGIHLPSKAPLLHFSKRQDMVAWPIARVKRAG
jgi:hypothetical protein